MILSTSNLAAKGPIIATRLRRPSQGKVPRHIATMVLTESAEFPVGAVAPDFELMEPLTGKRVSLAQAKGDKGTLVMFICNHCPFVVLLKEGLAQLGKDYQGKGIGIIAISSNSVHTHPQDGPDRMAEDAKHNGYTFPYLYDEDQSVAQAYKAMCTPEFYIFDGSLKLQYHGQFDSARPGKNVPVTGKDVRDALDAVLAGEPVPSAKPSIGCNIKWHPGKEPSYFG